MPTYYITVERTRVDRAGISIADATTPEEAQEKAMQWARRSRQKGVFHGVKTTARVISTALQDQPQPKAESED